MLPAPKTRVLIVDADVSVARDLQSHLVCHSFEVSIAGSGEEAIRMFRIFDPMLVLLDMTTHGMKGVDTLERLKQIKPDVSVILLSAQNDPETIFRASKLGADDYLSKPFESKDLDLHIAKVLDKQNLLSEVTQLREQVRRQSDFTMLFGTSPKMEEVKHTIEQVADTNATVLIRGESGTGKEVVARMVYAQSSRRDKPFVKVNCAAIPHELLESELFGYEPGAFTGANRQKPGKFDQANNGTIFLDEIGEMHPALQAKLLQVLQDGEFARLGGKHDIAVDVRVLAATNKPLESAVAEGMFREDLFYRLNVVTIHIPPLRERREEIPIFLDFFLRKYSEYYTKQPPPFSDYVISRMMEHSWPGNVRELENLVQRYVLGRSEMQLADDLAQQNSEPPAENHTDQATTQHRDPIVDDLARESSAPPAESHADQATTQHRDPIVVLYGENAKVATTFWEWRHKIIALFFAGFSGTFIAGAWLYDKDPVRALHYIPYMLILGMCFAIICFLLDTAAIQVLHGCYIVGKDLEAALSPSNAGIYTTLDRRPNYRRFTWVFRSIYLGAAVLIALLSALVAWVK